MNITIISPSVCKEIKARVTNLFRDKIMTKKEIERSLNGIQKHTVICETCREHLENENLKWDERRGWIRPK